MIGATLRRAAAVASGRSSLKGARSMSSGPVDIATEIKELKKWKAVTFLAMPVCAIKAFVDLSHGEHHAEEGPAYPYLRIRSKEFPWGDSGLFETEH